MFYVLFFSLDWIIFLVKYHITGQLVSLFLSKIMFNMEREVFGELINLRVEIRVDSVIL